MDNHAQKNDEWISIKLIEPMVICTKNKQVPNHKEYEEERNGQYERV